jgi:hypothetical protein
MGYKYDGVGGSVTVPETWKKTGRKITATVFLKEEQYWKWLQ